MLPFGPPTPSALTPSTRLYRTCSCVLRRPTPLASDQHLSLDCESMEHQLGAFLGPRPALEDLQRVLHSFANVVVQLSGGEPLSPEILTKIRHGDGWLPTNIKFVGMTMSFESFHNLLAGELDNISPTPAMGAITSRVSVSWRTLLMGMSAMMMMGRPLPQSTPAMKPGGGRMPRRPHGASIRGRDRRSLTRRSSS